MAERIAISRIRTDGGSQPRSTMLFDVVEEYANDMARGVEFPPVVLFYDGTDYWLADGYHRRQAAEVAGLEEILSDIRQGTRRDAILYSVGANASHGMRRTNEDKRRAVLTMLNDIAPACQQGHVCSEPNRCWSAWADRAIARQCAVHQDMVGRLRPASVGFRQIDEPRLVSRGGTTYKMNTGNIGRGEKSAGDGTSDDESPLPLGLDEEAEADDGALIFQCEDCSEQFASEVWHCPVCDYHWPRQKDHCSNCHAAKPELIATARPNIDLSEAHLWRSLRDAVEAIGSLPPPGETAEKFPRVLEHALRSEDVTAAARWLNEFAELWSFGQSDRDQRSQETLHRATEIMRNVAH